MKKLFFTLALLVQVGVTMAAEKIKQVAQVRHEKVKMYQQAGTSSAVLKELSTTDRLAVVRRLNSQWTIVMIGGVAGYVLHSELTDPPYQGLLATAAKR